MVDSNSWSQRRRLLLVWWIFSLLSSEPFSKNEVNENRRSNKLMETRTIWRKTHHETPSKEEKLQKNSGVSKIIHQLAASKFVQPTIDLYLRSLAYKQSYLGYPMFPIIFPKFQGPQLTAVASQNPRPKELTLQTLRSLLGLQLSCSWADIVVRRPIRGANTGSFSQFAPWKFAFFWAPKRKGSGVFQCYHFSKGFCC